MTITEHERHHLYELAKANWDETAATTLSTMISSMNSTDLATKSDIAENSSLLRVEMADIKTELRAEMADMRTELRGEIVKLGDKMDTLQARYVTWLLASQGVLAALIGTAAGVIIAVLK